MLKSAKQTQRRRYNQSRLILLIRQERPIKQRTNLPPIRAVHCNNTLSENPLKSGEFFNRHPLPGNSHWIIKFRQKQETTPGGCALICLSAAT